MRKSGPLLLDNPELGFHPDFSLKRLSHSDTAMREGIDNTPTGPVCEALQRLSHTLSAIEQRLGTVLMINSGYRCPKLNARVGGVPDSQHVHGLAADIKTDGTHTALELAQAIAQTDIVFDQLIVEYGKWVHLSIAASGDTPRREILTIRSNQEGYLAGLHPEQDTA